MAKRVISKLGGKSGSIASRKPVLSPKMEAELKSSGLSKGQINDLKKSDSTTVKKLNALKKNISNDQVGKINRLFSQKSEGNFKGKKQSQLSTIPSKDIDNAVNTVNDLYSKMKSGKYSKSDYMKYTAAQGKVVNAMGKRGDVDIKVNKAKLTFKPKNPSDNIKADAVKGNIAAEVKRLKEKKQKKTSKENYKSASKEDKAKERKRLAAIALKKEQDTMGFSKGGMPTTYKGGVLNGHGKDYGKPGGYNMGGLATPTAKQTGLKKLPSSVRNKMGYMYGGGMANKKNMGSTDYRKGGLVIMIGTGKPMKTKKEKN